MRDDELERLRKFYEQVADMTVRHDELEGSAVVFPNKLGEALATVDPNWYREWRKRTGNKVLGE